VRIGLSVWAGIGAGLVFMAAVAPKTDLRIQTQNQAANIASSLGQKSTVGATALATSAATMAEAPVARALVDERLNGDGVGLPLGINDPVLGWVLLSVFLLVWGLYSTSVRSISNNDDEDSGSGSPTGSGRGASPTMRSMRWRLGSTRRK